MLVRTARLTNVRGRSELTVELKPGLNILAGPNGAGKTTVLEALALVLQGDLLRPGAVRGLIKREADFLRVETILQSPGVQTGSIGAAITATAAYTRAGERRLSADGAELEDASRWRELLPVRTFVPDDLRLIKGGPRRRREYLDALTVQGDPGYGASLKQYEEALAQRNSLLRVSRHGFDDALFTPWERILARTGLSITQARARRLQEFVGLFQTVYEDITGDAPDSVRLVYRSNVVDLDGPSYQERLAEMRDADRQRTFTHLGPHRDDLRLFRHGLDVRESASQGEQRAALLTLVLAEWAQSGGTGPRPLLLLDDVMSELDEQRRRALVAVVSRGGQTVITTVDLRYFAEPELREANVIELGAGS